MASLILLYNEAEPSMMLDTVAAASVRERDGEGGLVEYRLSMLIMA